MRKILTTLCLVLVSLSTFASMSSSKMREYARFLSDRMAYELDMTARQYDDCYEINLDFLYSVNPYLNDMVLGYHDAIDRYYMYLDDRNDDMRYIMTIAQYEKFMRADYFYRPIYSTGRDWTFRVYTIYRNYNFFYYDAPIAYKTYVLGSHSRVMNNHGSYYLNRHNFDHYHTYSRFHDSRDYSTHRRNDFGANERRRDGGKYDINHYNNRNQSNRTSDVRYHDNSGNRNSPDINRRSDSNTRTTDNNRSQSSDTNKSTTTDVNNNNGHGNSNGQTTTRSTSRSDANVQSRSSETKTNNTSRSTQNRR